MDRDAIREECLRMIEHIVGAGEDVAYPVREGVKGITICGSADGYVLRTDIGPEEYDDAEDMLEALLGVEQDVHEESDPLEAVHQSLAHIAG